MNSLMRNFISGRRFVLNLVGEHFVCRLRDTRVVSRHASSSSSISMTAAKRHFPRARYARSSLKKARRLQDHDHLLHRCRPGSPPVCILYALQSADNGAAGLEAVSNHNLWRSHKRTVVFGAEYHSVAWWLRNHIPQMFDCCQCCALGYPKGRSVLAEVGTLSHSCWRDVPCGSIIRRSDNNLATSRS